ncbi:MAG: peptide/nickel transport system permease protein [Acidobacteriota bacterium]|nr:peptide/nickel transport system permease protein [Acidobacteriota bacterium]
MRLHMTASSNGKSATNEGARSFSSRARGLTRGRARLIVGLIIVAAFYVVAALADFVAPYDYGSQSRDETLAPATAIHFFDDGGRFHARSFIRARRLVDPLARSYAEDNARDYTLALFARGYSYDFLGIFKTDRHLFGVADEETHRQTSSLMSMPRVNLLGTDKLGRDRFSRLVRAARFSLAVAPLGALFAGALGVLVGCVAGYAGRKIDAVLMRAADAMLALPALVLILAARAALPIALPTARAAAFLVAVFVAVGWAETARLVRGLVMELRGREFVTAARSLGMTETRVLFRHVLPNASRAIIVQLSLMVPAFLLAETALSFLGVGVQEPDVSWGTMLADANSTTQLAEQPLLLLAPAFAIFLFVLGVRLLSDGLRRVSD